MKLATVDGLACIRHEGSWLLVESVTQGRVRGGVDQIIRREELQQVAQAVAVLSSAPAGSVREGRLGPPIQVPGTIFGWGLNFAAHAEEASATKSGPPTVFVKLPSAVNGPHDAIVLPSGHDQVDWEAELAVIIGKSGRRITASEAWEHVAGLCCAQDISERYVQLNSGSGQFNLGKGFDTFCPLGPELTTLDEAGDVDTLEIVCRLNGEIVQHARLGDMVSPIPEIIESLSAITTLRAGDVLLCGSPRGVGLFQDPPRFLRAGDLLETEITGLGSLRNPVVTEATV